ncbi:ComF operon protein A [Gracilibacillus boraciitolerans JCM 21714]|uniref:ComF operon protein A n=1 Tax=Gracilibacillus boraciitolerans JCM 21714 TaxID=1298598 RepID=W4VQL7_9BACI|nr:ComF operon protein A [Gracilibacillus boraciitolerans JCM 21714]
MDAGHQVFDEAALVQIAGRAGRSPNDPTGNVIFIHQAKPSKSNKQSRK